MARRKQGGVAADLEALDEALDTNGTPADTTAEADTSASELDDTALARDTLRAVCRDRNAPAAARAQAARTLAEMTGALTAGRRGPDDAPPPVEMTVEDMRRELSRLRASH